MQRSPAIVSACLTMSAADIGECSSSARAAACAKAPPEPIATMPSSGSSTSPVPVSTSDAERSATASIASRRRKHAVRSPILRELDGGAHEVALVLFELGLEPLEQRERVRRGARESREHAIVIQAAHFARGRLDHDVAERDLAVAAQCHRAVAANGNNGGAVELFHLRRMNTHQRHARLRCTATLTGAPRSREQMERSKSA